MKKLLLTVAVCATSVSSFAQSLMWEYNPKTKSLSNLVAQPVGTLNSVPALGKIDVSLVGGVQYENGALTVGGMLSRSFQIGTFSRTGGDSSPVHLVLGVTGRVTAGAVPKFGGFAAGLTWRF